MAQRDGQCAMAAHGVTKDRLPLRIDRKIPGNQFRQFFRDIAPHPVVAGKRFLAVLSQPEHLAAQVEIVAQVFGRPLVDHPAALQRYRGIRQR